MQPVARKKNQKAQSWAWLTSWSVYDSLDVKKETSKSHLHQQLVAVVQTDAKGKDALQHSLLWLL